MKTRLVGVMMLLLVFIDLSNAQEKIILKTGLQKIKLAFSLDQKGKASYSVSFGDKQVITDSRLGFIINHHRLDSNFQIIKIDSSVVDNSWNPVWGEVKTIRNHYQQLKIQLQQRSAPFYKLNIVFKVFEEGVGFRYEFPLQNNLKFFTVNDELTEFNLTADH
jgi:hypothetical protein